jgi:hypothetical protein
MITQTSALAAALAIFGTVQSHMIINTPTPFNLKGTGKLLQVDPLDGEKFPFPCQGATEVVSRDELTAGATQLVKFTGGAQHGGGSCQFSVTYENPPPADKSKWKTIYTLIGGCPVSAEGNLAVSGTDESGRADAEKCGDDSGVECIRQFDVPIPKELPSGDATFAWTWFNKIGNREVYMNCAPVTIKDGGDDQAFFDELPEMFLANIPGECQTGNGVLNIPNPGKFGRVLEEPTPGSEGNCPKAAGPPSFEGGSGAGGGAGGAGGDAGGDTDTGSSSAAAPSNTPTAQPDATAPAETTAASSGFATQTTPGAAPAPTPTPTPTPGSGSGSGSGSGGSGGDLGTAPAGAQPCSPDGAIICFSPTSFGLCANGAAMPMAVAAGTTCTNGNILRRSAKFHF